MIAKLKEKVQFLSELHDKSEEEFMKVSVDFQQICMLEQHCALHISTCRTVFVTKALITTSRLSEQTTHTFARVQPIVHKPMSVMNVHSSDYATCVIDDNW